MVITHHSIDIKRPIDQVFAFLMEPQNYMLWQSNLVSLEASNRMQVGSRLVFCSMGLGRRFELEAKVTANNGRDHFEAVSARGPLTFTTQYELKAIPGGTQLNLHNDIRTHGVFKLAADVLQSMGEAKYQADLEQLKIILENDVKPITPEQ